MMDERLRLEYLEAMGIQNWVARDPVSDAVPMTEEKRGTRAEGRGPRSESPTVETVLQDDVSGLDWEALRFKVDACQACSLHQTRTQSVFGVGNQNADLMIIGEAPGADEDRQGEPFVGPAGLLLNAMLKAIGLDRGEVFIANILKCRPPGNRDPHVDEANCCEPFLQRQIELIKPKVILAVGRVAAQNLLKTDVAVGRLRNCEHVIGGTNIPVIVTYHPAYLLRSPDQKGKAWQDLQLAARKLRVS